MNTSRDTLRDGAITSAVALIPMLPAVSRDLDWFDGPELALAAIQWGVGHPPGQPLHALLGGVLARCVPNAYFGVALLSAVSVALCAVPAMALADGLVGGAPTTRGVRIARAGAVLAGLWVPPVFETATRVEVYGLASLGMLAALALAGSRRGFAAGVALGLTASVNSWFALSAGLGVAIALKTVAPRRAVLHCVAGGLVGMLPLLHVPLAARHPERFVWGEADTLRGFVEVLTARDFAGNVGIHGGNATRAILAQGRGVVFVALAALCVVAAGAMRNAALPTHRARAGWWGAVVAVAALAATLLINAPLRANPDLAGYLVPLFALCGAGVATVLSRAKVPLLRTASALPALGVASAVAGLSLDLAWISTRSHGIHALRHRAEAMLAEAPPRAILVLETDHAVFPLEYLQSIEHRRPDVVLLNAGWANSRWFWQRLARNHPGLRVDLRPGSGRWWRMESFLSLNSERPVVAEGSHLLGRLRVRVCEGVFMVHARPDCGAPALGRRLQLLATMSNEVRGEWIGERVVSSIAGSLADEARAQGAAGRAVATLAAVLPDGITVLQGLRGWNGGPVAPRGPFVRPADEALVSPEWVRQALELTLVEAGRPGLQSHP